MASALVDTRLCNLPAPCTHIQIQFSNKIGVPQAGLQGCAEVQTASQGDGDRDRNRLPKHPPKVAWKQVSRLRRVAGASTQESRCSHPSTQILRSVGAREGSETFLPRGDFTPGQGHSL